MKRFIKIFLNVLKWALLTALGVEIFCFLVIIGTNLMLFSQPWEGSAANYDAYAIFLNAEGVRPTLHNPAEASPGADGKGPKRLWLLGGSTMRGGWGVQEGETIPSYLAEILNQTGNADKVEVTNYGENSFNSLLETKYLQKLLIKAAQAPGPDHLLRRRQRLCLLQRVPRRSGPLRLPPVAGAHRELPSQLLQPVQAPIQRPLFFLYP